MVVENSTNFCFVFSLFWVFCVGVCCRYISAEFASRLTSFCLSDCWTGGPWRDLEEPDEQTLAGACPWRMR